MLITPVRGSVDAYLSHLPPSPTRCVATLISRAASFTSSTFTSASRRIFASASANRIIDSNWRGVAVITLLATAFAPCARIFTYSSSSCVAASSEIRGFTNFLAYATYRYPSHPPFSPTSNTRFSTGARSLRSFPANSDTRCLASDRSAVWSGLSRMR